MTYTFYKEISARTTLGESVIIPDQLASLQPIINKQSFPVARYNGRKAMAVLIGGEYGLHSTDTGDAIVRII